MPSGAGAHVEHATSTALERCPIELGERALEREVLLGLDLEEHAIGAGRVHAARAGAAMVIEQRGRERLGGADATRPEAGKRTHRRKGQ